MKIKRYVAAAVTAGVLGTVTLATGITALAATGWVQNGSSYVYYDTDGTLHKGWVLLYGSFHRRNVHRH